MHVVSYLIDQLHVQVCMASQRHSRLNCCALRYAQLTLRFRPLACGLAHGARQEFRKGDLVVFPGELMVGVHFVVRGKMHVADAAMWPEAVNRRGRCSGVRFNLATSSHAVLPLGEEEDEYAAQERKEAEEREQKKQAKEEKQRQRQEEKARRKMQRDGSLNSGYLSPLGSPLFSPLSSMGRRATSEALVFADRRPPSLAPEAVMRLPEGCGGHQEGGWEAVAGAGPLFLLLVYWCALLRACV